MTSSRLPFRPSLPSDDDDDHHVSLHFVSSPRGSLTASGRRHSPMGSSTPLVQRWETPLQNWDGPLPDQLYKDCRHIHDLLRHRTRQYTSPQDHALRQSAWKTESIIGSLVHTETLSSHTGCVNTIHWNNDGSLLISSGDDCRLTITDYADLSKQTIIPTGHTENVFCARVVPAKPEWVVTCSGDNQIRLFDINTCQLLLTYEGHTDRVKKFVIPPCSSSSSLSVYSCSDDGTVKLIDLRAKVKAAATPRSGQSIVDSLRSGRHSGRPFRRLSPLFDDIPFLARQQRRSTSPLWASILGDGLRRDGGPDTVAIFKQANHRFTSSDRPAKAISSIALSSLRPEYLVIGGELPSIWLLDRRLLGRPSSGSRLTAQTEPIAEFKPKDRPKCLNITGVDISHDGTRVIGSWSGERIYQFNIDDTLDAQANKCQKHRSFNLRNRFNIAKRVSSPHGHDHYTNPSRIPIVDSLPSTNNLDPIDIDTPPLSSRPPTDGSTSLHHRKRQRTDFGPYPVTTPSPLQRPSHQSLVPSNQQHASSTSDLQQQSRALRRRITILSSRYRRPNSRRRLIVISNRLRSEGSLPSSNSLDGSTTQSLPDDATMADAQGPPSATNPSPQQHGLTSTALRHIRTTLEESRRRLERLQGESRDLLQESERLLQDVVDGEEEHEDGASAERRRQSEGNAGSAILPRRSARIQELMRRRSLEENVNNVSGSGHRRDSIGSTSQGSVEDSRDDASLRLSQEGQSRSSLRRRPERSRILNQSIRLREELSRLRRAAYSVRLLPWRIDEPPRDPSSSSSNGSNSNEESEEYSREIVSESEASDPFVLSTNLDGSRRRRRRRRRSMADDHLRLEQSDEEREHLHLGGGHDTEASSVSANNPGDDIDDDDDELNRILVRSRNRQRQREQERRGSGSFAFVPPNTFIWRAERPETPTTDDGHDGHRTRERRMQRQDHDSDSVAGSLSSVSSSESSSDTDHEARPPGNRLQRRLSRRRSNKDSFPGVPYSQVYKGHCNRRTVKEVQYLGPSSEWVASGSDDGRFFIWNQNTSKLAFIGQNADSEVVNCVVDHPRDLVLATSGIDSDVKIWRPGPLLALDRRSEKIRRILRDNERQRVSPSVHSFAFQHAMLFFQLLENAQRLTGGEASQDDESEPSEQIAR